ncbi:cell division protein FtsK [Amycolatopsis sp. FU40]|uniref:FtsK/SpoIIIE domain-containing protein n=1 Tax=Amycolatopsis sp. FU40 TaxID=2914159 RepID=UPI001F38EF98|nr:FtsK/SpoIIIE domain-containing protein [Amycolatopsis sp. FU40]UKD53662.1 cell division protein FtsK [Amycolatopsis sp. FU40]
MGIDENAHRVALTLMYKNLLVGGEPGSGKSSLVNTIVGHAAMSPDCRMWLFDGKLVELDPWRDVADVFVGNDMTRALLKLRELQYELDIRYAMLRKAGRRKIVRDDGLDAILFVIDELALYSATYGTKEEREEFVRILRDIVARGRAAGIITLAATQRPSADIIPTSLRDLFSYRVAFRCTTDSSSDIILSVGWAQQGFSAKRIDPEQTGVGLLLAEGGIPGRLKAAYLNDNHIRSIVAFARDIRRTAA